MDSRFVYSWRSLRRRLRRDYHRLCGDDLGLSCEQVRGGAMIAAIFIAALVAVDYFGKKLGKAK
jgi:hypothetical protein